MQLLVALVLGQALGLAHQCHCLPVVGHLSSFWPSGACMVFHHLFCLLPMHPLATVQPQDVDVLDLLVAICLVPHLLSVSLCHLSFSSQCPPQLFLLDSFFSFSLGQQGMLQCLMDQLCPFWSQHGWTLPLVSSWASPGPLYTHRSLPSSRLHENSCTQWESSSQAISAQNLSPDCHS